MISFITSTIDNPWTDSDIRNYEEYGSQRDTVQYNSFYNCRIKLTDKNMFLCSLKTNDNDYKNIYLFAVTRRLFYFAIFIPQLEVIKQWSKNEQGQKFVAALPLTSKCLSSSNKELNLDDEILFLDGSCMLVKVNAPVDGFLFPRNKSITNNVIKKQYALLNNLYFQFEREFDGLEKMIRDYDAKVGEYNAKLREHNEKIERRLEEQQEKLKRMLVRKGVRTGVSIALAGITGGLSLGLDALFDLGDIADIQDVMDMADAASMVGDAMDAFNAVDVMDACDAYDILDADLMDFSVADMNDINILDVGEGDDLLADSYDLDIDHSVSHENISFGASESSIKTDINYNTRKLNQANTDIDYYTRELKRTNISDTYRKDCQYNLKQAVKNATELAKKISKLKDELDKITG